MAETPADDDTARSVRRWVSAFVVDLNLCPFAKRQLTSNRIRFATTHAVTEDALLIALQSELDLLEHDSTIETTLLIHPHVLQNFLDYNQFLDLADNLLQQMDLEGVYQIASFHPDYQFSGTQPEDAENYTNRSPYPLLHLLREASIDRAIQDYPDIDQVPARNTERMNALGVRQLRYLRDACFDV